MAVPGWEMAPGMLAETAGRCCYPDYYCLCISAMVVKRHAARRLAAVMWHKGRGHWVQPVVRSASRHAWQSQIVSITFLDGRQKMCVPSIIADGDICLESGCSNKPHGINTAMQRRTP